MHYDCDVIIAGGGPVGLFLAAELGMRGLSTAVFDDKPGTSTHPAANANSARTMEHYRRLGIAAEIRSVGLPADHPTDVAYFTRLATHELARLRQPSSSFAVNRLRELESIWPTPELPHRCSQLYVEPVLRRAAESHARNRVQYLSTVQNVQQDDDGVLAEIAGPDGAILSCRARYLVGCDGPRSTIRSLMELHYAGTAGEKRGFMGGRMAAAYFSAPALQERLKGKRAWQYWTLNPVQRSLILEVDGRGRFIINIQLREDQEPDDDDVGRRIATAVGFELPFELISNSAWTAGFALVAEKMRVGHVFLAGDAAHLFTPTGGLGYNTGIEDAANLAWKLEAMIKGDGGPALLDSYEAERRPGAHRNTGFARQFADSIGNVPVPAEIESDTPAGHAARQAVGSYLNFHAYKEFSIPGVHLGARYEGSPIVSTEAGCAPPDMANLYVPCGRPGHRAPHLWLDDGQSLYDQFGQGFTLLRLGAASSAAAGPSAGKKNANRAGLADRAYPPGIRDLSVAGSQARDLYGADYVLIRPDQHIAWRGNRLDDAYAAALDRTLGKA